MHSLSINRTKQPIPRLNVLS